MKVGTDGVLLGAWAPLDHRPERILDIGTGTGLIALMLAQRSDATRIDGVEIERQAYAQCASNFRASPWSDRLHVYSGDLNDFRAQAEITYDLMVCNPPFYKEQVRYSDQARFLARQQAALPADMLIDAAAQLLSEKGVLAVIIPAGDEGVFSEQALGRALYVQKRCEVRGTYQAPVKRCLLAFGRSRPVRLESESLVIEESRHRYTSEYLSLTREFYLKF